MRRQILERNVLFLCEDNACLSQMAEAAAKHLAPPRTVIFSAGVKPGVIPSAVVQAMPWCRSRASIDGSRPRKALNDSIAGRLPPASRID